MTGLHAPGAWAPGVTPSGPDAFPGEFVVTDLPNLPDEWLIELGATPEPVNVQPPALGMPGGVAVGAMPDDLPATGGAGLVLRFSLRGWIGEPNDAAQPNVAYPDRLVEPPTLVRSLRVLPEDTARLNFQAGELALDNADGGLDFIGGDWAMAGRLAVLRRGPYRTPIRAMYNEFGRVADLRITSAAMTSGTRLTVALRDAAADLSVPVCGVYAGTGGLEGDVALAGQSRPLLLGFKPNIAPTRLLATLLVWQVSSVPLQAVFALRDGGAPLTLVGDYPTLEALLAAPLPTSSYATCLTHGLVRTGSPPAGQLTCDARSPGDISHAGIALALLQGPGGLSGERIVRSGFAQLPLGDAGWIWRSGTVTAALDQVFGSCAGWWGSDRLGRIVAGRLAQPELLGPRMIIERWMVTADPSEVAGVAPRWRQRVAYHVLDQVQTATDLFGIAEEDPALVAAYGTAQQVATAYDTRINQIYPSATDPDVLVSGFRTAGPAQALADDLLALHGTRRRRWRVPVGKWGHLIDLGDVVAVDHPRLAGRHWQVIASDEVGDAKTLTLWG
ncbi:hypothetical protein [Pseudoroseomonas ludipueritiae]|uniref:Phage tail protein n=1 Tax=Pseudoroseomonas ludipueritiae TaxID=198093 RepID=A0ABR7R514_9PROT|nr:hypothetical protein [Pseudoroseomonas ludipueritiae]MBC9176759.1 hypothetical protein [Pseudoroseomonas ludipueritiae]